MNNPLLTFQGLPPFSKIQAEHIVPALQAAIDACQQQVAKVLSTTEDFTWQTLCQPLEETDDRLNRIWSPIQHLHAVKNDPKWRSTYEEALQLLSHYGTWLGQHQALYQAYCDLKAGPNFEALSPAQAKAVENSLRDFKLSGVALPTVQKQRYAEIAARLSELSSHFNHNVLDATMGWHKLITDAALLAGLPEHALAAAHANAQAHGEEGWRLTLDIPSYLAVMTYCDQRALRYECYRAYNTRASELGANPDRWDNSAIITETLALRHEEAQLLGFASYAHCSLATKMARDPQQVLDFLHDLARRARPQAEQDLAELCQFARDHFDVNVLEPWDIAYYSEKLKQQRHAMSEEQLRPYFPAPRVLNGLFEVVKRVFGVTLHPSHDVDLWHSEVQLFDMYDQNGIQLGRVYLDLYVRECKQGGAWVHECIAARRDSTGQWQQPVAYITCNFNRPLGDQPALLTHDEVLTLFHEFGHALHHLLTQVDVAAVSGNNGVPWDAIELPSQFLENWCWQPQALVLLSGHYQSGESLPEVLLTKLLAAKNFQAALGILRQVEFSLLDFQLHAEYQPGQDIAQIMETLAQIKRQVAVLPSPDWLRTPHTFMHIFAGSYAAGYYSYFWAEVLSADAFSRFEAEGIFNPALGREFLEAILARGGVEDPLLLFKQFRGREPSLEAFLRYQGIEASLA